MQFFEAICSDANPSGCQKWKQLSGGLMYYIFQKRHCSMGLSIFHIALYGFIHGITNIVALKCRHAYMFAYFDTQMLHTKGNSAFKYSSIFKHEMFTILTLFKMCGIPFAVHSTVRRIAVPVRRCVSLTHRYISVTMASHVAQLANNVYIGFSSRYFSLKYIMLQFGIELILWHGVSMTPTWLNQTKSNQKNQVCLSSNSERHAANNIKQTQKHFKCAQYDNISHFQTKMR